MNTKMKAQSNTVVKHYFTYDHIKKAIIGSEYNFTRSGIPGSEQDRELMMHLAEHPDYALVVVKPTKMKQTYAGLTRELMYDYLYILNEKDLLTKFNEMKDASVSYPTMKSWFLEAFPNFNVDQAKKEIKKARLSTVKAKYKIIRATPKTVSNIDSTLNFPKASGQ